MNTSPLHLIDAGLLANIPAADLPARWQPMLAATADLARRCLLPPEPPLQRPWINIGPGYCYGPAFGHFDLIHMVFDLVGGERDIATDQMENLLDIQRSDGAMPFLWMSDNPARLWMPVGLSVEQRLAADLNWPPLWPAGIEACWQSGAGEAFLVRAAAALDRTLAWWEANRRLVEGGYFYGDLLAKGKWESGMDQCVRFADPPPRPMACIDACSHVLWCRRFAAAWARRLGRNDALHRQAAADLAGLISSQLFSEETGWFHDAWSVNDPTHRPLAWEGVWALVAGAATPAQAQAAIDRNLLEPKRFFTPHPIATVAHEDPRFALRMMHGPAWNSFTLWAVEGCLAVERPDAARSILGAALDATATIHARTGTLWEFYHPLGGDPNELMRKPGQKKTVPCHDYYGHNPLRAMARIWSTLGSDRS